MGTVKRSYDSSRRQEQARSRRRTVVAAAGDLFERRGYRGTTIADVAQAAGVSAEMVYKSFGTKADLAKAVFDVAVAGDDEPVAVRDRPAVRALRAEPDARRKVAGFVEGLVQRMERSARVQILVRDGRHVDASLGPVWDELQAEGLTGMGMLADELVQGGQLRAGVTREDARDILWNYLAIDHYERLVLQRHWPLSRFQTWLTSAITDALT